MTDTPRAAHATAPRLAWAPTEVSPPGETLLELIEERGIAQSELARRMGRPLNAINEIVLGTKEITEDTALEFERVLGTPAQFWLTRESRYREYLARQRDASRTPDRLAWLETLPLKAMQEMGSLPAGRLTAAFKSTLVDAALRFFGVANPEGWQKQYLTLQLAFRRSHPARQTNTAAITAWLRLGEIEAARQGTAPFSAEKLHASLGDMRALSTHSASDIGPALKALCAQAGVVLLFVPAFSGTHVSGVARWLGDRPLIQLSLLGKVNDLFWFNFFHEVGHVLKHPKRAVFLDDATTGGTQSSKEEQEANQFAADVLIAPADRKTLAQLELTASAIQVFAQKIGIHPGIVVGALQHIQRVNYASPLARLKQRYDIA